MTDGPLFVAIDASTTAAKALVVDATGRALASGRATYPLVAAGPDGWEQDATRWFEATLEALGAAVAALEPAERARIASLAIACQRETFVVTDPTGAPLAPARVWMDARCRGAVDEARAAYGAEALHRETGKVPCPTPSLYKIRDLLGGAPTLRAADKRVCDVHAFLVWHLTGELASSTSAADPTGLLPLGAAAFSSALAALAHLDVDELPRLVRPGEVIGVVRDALADRVGLPRGVRVVAGAGDGQAAALGAGVVEEGEAYLNLGTALVAGVPCRTPRIDRAFRTMVAGDGDGYLLETDLLGGTLTLDWLADRLLGTGELEGTAARGARLAALEAEARALPAGAGGLVALPYWAGVMNPFWSDAARGALIGLRVEHGPAHVYRAICEGIALEQRLALEAVERATEPIRTVVVVGGGARSGLFAQIVADTLGRPLVRAASDEATALGAAILAARGAGAFASTRDAVAAMTSRAGSVAPGPDAPRYERLAREVYAGLFEALRPRFEALGAFARER